MTSEGTIVSRNPMVPKMFTVERARRELQDTYSIDVRPSDGTPSPAFLPGQFNMLYIFGVGEVPISISGDPSKQDHMTHTIRSVGAVSQAITRLKKGNTLGLRGPFGLGWPVAEAAGKDILIVAGGIGLAPLRPVIFSVLSRPEIFGRLVVLYGARSPNEVLYAKELARWRRKGARVWATVDHAGSGWEGEVGVVTRLIPKATFDPLNTTAFICGPEIMMRFTIKELEASGVGDESIYISLERNMKCAVGFCGHCQFGPSFLCKDGPVFPYSQVKSLLLTREV